nr:MULTISPECIES: hypothetical protein [Porphyromonadaceae]
MREKILQKVLSVIFFIAILIGCQKDYFDPEYFEKNYIIQNIPKNFDWSNISTLDVTVLPYDTHNNKYFYTIEIFDENPVFEKEKAILLAKGVGSQNQTFQTYGSEQYQSSHRRKYGRFDVGLAGTPFFPLSVRSDLDTKSIPGFRKMGKIRRYKLFGMV